MAQWREHEVDKVANKQPIRQLDPVAYEILGLLLVDFREKKLSADNLREEYEGISLSTLIEKCCASNRTDQVDFDLALKQLEDNKLVATGPMEPYNNPPGASAVFIGFFSKREYVYLTEAGYRAVRNSR